MRKNEKGVITLIEVTLMGLVGLVFVLGFFMLGGEDGTATNTMKNDINVNCAIFNTSEELVEENPDSGNLCPGSGPVIVDELPD